MKDADIVHALQLIETREGLDIDKDAIKLIASRSDGSLRDAKMTLEQLSLLGRRISVPLVQELVSLVMQAPMYYFFICSMSYLSYPVNILATQVGDCIINVACPFGN